MNQNKAFCPFGRYDVVQKLSEARPSLMPPEPHNPALGIACSRFVGVPLLGGLGLLVLGLVAYNVFVLAGPRLEIDLMALVGAVSSIYIALESIRAATLKEQRYQEDKIAWDAAIVKWGQLYYCPKHNLVFNPLDGRQCLPSHVVDFCYSGPSVLEMEGFHRKVRRNH